MKHALLVLAFLLATTSRLPAPIQEVPESPTPAPERSAKPKPKRTVKPKTSENPESSTKNKAPSTTPLPQRNPFDGTWTGHYETGLAGDVQYTFTISGPG